MSLSFAEVRVVNCSLDSISTSPILVEELDVLGKKQCADEVDVESKRQQFISGSVFCLSSKCEFFQVDNCCQEVRACRFTGSLSFRIG